MAILALAFVPYAVALLLALGTPPLARTFLTPASRPKGWLFLPTWLVTVLPVWALAPIAWAAVAHAAVSAALGEGGMRAQWVGRGWVGRVWLAWALVEVRLPRPSLKLPGVSAGRGRLACPSRFRAQPPALPQPPLCLSRADSPPPPLPPGPLVDPPPPPLPVPSAAARRPRRARPPAARHV